jgi:hypothetical protein
MKPGFASWYISIPKIRIGVYFGGPGKGKMYILCPFAIF